MGTLADWLFPQAAKRIEEIRKKRIAAKKAKAVAEASENDSKSVEGEGAAETEAEVEFASVAKNATRHESDKEGEATAEAAEGTDM